VWSQYLLTSTWAMRPGVAKLLAIGRSGAAAWWIVSQARQPYLGRRMRMTRSRVGPSRASVVMPISSLAKTSTKKRSQSASPKKGV
jgi:hypothetical protein